MHAPAARRRRGLTRSTSQSASHAPTLKVDAPPFDRQGERRHRRRYIYGREKRHAAAASRDVRRRRATRGPAHDRLACRERRHRQAALHGRACSGCGSVCRAPPWRGSSQRTVSIRPTCLSPTRPPVSHAKPDKPHSNSPGEFSIASPYPSSRTTRSPTSRSLAGRGGASSRRRAHLPAAWSIVTTTSGAGSFTEFDHYLTITSRGMRARVRGRALSTGKARAFHYLSITCPLLDHY